MLQFIAVDEIQLFLHYGLSFWSYFTMLSTTIFKLIKNGWYATKGPVLFMTSSCISEIFQQLKVLNDLEFYHENRNVLWACSVELMKRSVYTRVAYINRPLTQFVSSIGSSIGSNPGHRFVFYANSRVLIETSADKYGKWLEKPTSFQSDYLKILGTMKKEEKFHAVKLFSTCW